MTNQVLTSKGGHKKKDQTDLIRTTCLPLKILQANTQKDFKFISLPIRISKTQHWNQTPFCSFWKYYDERNLVAVLSLAHHDSIGYIYYPLFSMTTTCSPPQANKKKGKIHFVYQNPFVNSTTKVNPLQLLQNQLGGFRSNPNKYIYPNHLAPASGIQNHITLVDLAEGCRMMSQHTRWSPWCITLPKMLFFLLKAFENNINCMFHTISPS